MTRGGGADCTIARRSRAAAFARRSTSSAAAGGMRASARIAAADLDVMPRRDDVGMAKEPRVRDPSCHTTTCVRDRFVLQIPLRGSASAQTGRGEPERFQTELSDDRVKRTTKGVRLRPHHAVVMTLSEHTCLDDINEQSITTCCAPFARPSAKDMCFKIATTTKWRQRDGRETALQRTTRESPGACRLRTV